MQQFHAASCQSLIAVFCCAQDQVTLLCVQVPIPEPLRSGIVVLSCLDFLVCLGWETMLRYTFPAKIPPQKGYMAFDLSEAPVAQKKLH